MKGAAVANLPAVLIDDKSGKVILEIAGPVGVLMGKETRRLLITKPGAPTGLEICLQLIDGNNSILWEYELQILGGYGSEVK